MDCCNRAWNDASALRCNNIVWRQLHNWFFSCHFSGSRWLTKFLTFSMVPMVTSTKTASHNWSHRVRVVISLTISFILEKRDQFTLLWTQFRNKTNVVLILNLLNYNDFSCTLPLFSEENEWQNVPIKRFKPCRSSYQDFYIVHFKV